VRARYRLLVQLIAAICCVSFGGQILPDVGNLLGTGDLDAWWIVVPVSILGTVAVVNAVNFTDGADGLCGGLGIVGLFWFVVALTSASATAAAAGIEPASHAGGMLALAAAAIGALAGFLV